MLFWFSGKSWPLQFAARRSAARRWPLSAAAALVSFHFGHFPPGCKHSDDKTPTRTDAHAGPDCFRRVLQIRANEQPGLLKGPLPVETKRCCAWSPALFCSMCECDGGLLGEWKCSRSNWAASPIAHHWPARPVMSSWLGPRQSVWEGTHVSSHFVSGLPVAADERRDAEEQRVKCSLPPETLSQLDLRGSTMQRGTFNIVWHSA